MEWQSLLLNELALGKKNMADEANALTRVRCCRSNVEPGDGGMGTARSAQESASRPDALVGRRAKATSGSGRNVRAAGDAGIEGVRVGALAPATALCECCAGADNASGLTWLMLRC